MQTRAHEKYDAAVQPGPHAARSLTGANRALEIFVGSWEIRGRNAPDAPAAPSTSVTGDDVYELMPGGFFVHGRWNHQFDGRTHMGMSVLGVDPETERHFAHHYDNLGYARSYEVSVRDLTWTFDGSFERAMLVFAADGRSFVQAWEISEDGRIWRPLCELRGVRR